MASLRVQICCLLAYATFLSLITCQNLPKRHVALFILGDSLFDPGNNNYINTTNEYRANFWPYGKTFFRYPTGRFSDGRLIQDFIGKHQVHKMLFPSEMSIPNLHWLPYNYVAAEYARLPLIPAYLQLAGNNHKFIYGVNLASRGDGALAETHQGLVCAVLLN